MAMVGKFPGVYPEIIDLSQVVTSNSIVSCGYVGEAEFGPINKPVLISNLRGYTTKFGALSSNYGYMGYSLAVAQDSINAHYVVRVVGDGAQYAFTRVPEDGKTYTQDEIDTWFTNYKVNLDTMAAIEKDHNAAFVQTPEGSSSEITDNKSVLFIAADNPNNRSYKIRITDSTINTNKNYKSLSTKLEQETINNETITHVYVTVPEMFKEIGNVSEQIFNEGDKIIISNASNSDINGKFEVKEVKNTYYANPDMSQVPTGTPSSLSVVSEDESLVVLSNKDYFEAHNPHDSNIYLEFVYLEHEESGEETEGGWTLNGEPVDLASYGVAVEGTPLPYDAIMFNYVAKTPSGKGTGYRIGDKVYIEGLHIDDSLTNAIAYVDDVDADTGEVKSVSIYGNSSTLNNIESGLYNTINMSAESTGRNLKIYIDVETVLNVVAYDITLPVDIPSEDPEVKNTRIQKYPEDDETTFTLSVYETVGKVTTLLETYQYCTLYEAKDNYGNSTFVEDVINGKSNIIRVYVNTDNENMRKVPNETFTYGDDGRVTGYTYLSLQNGTSGEKPTTKQLNEAWELFGDRSLTDVSLLMNSGYAYEGDTSYQQAMLAVAEKRRDCFCLFDIPSTLSDMEDVLDWRQNVNGMNTYRGALFTPWALTYNSVLGKRNFAMCPSAYVAKIMGSSVYPWVAPAGPNRGTLSSSIVTPMGLTAYYDDTQGGELYDKQLNCFIKDTVGYANWGQKTLQQKPSALDRINVARTVIYIEKTLRAAARLHLFENNTAYERMQVTLQFSQFLDTVLNAEGIQRYQVICDDSNNTPYIIAQNQLVIDIYLWPTYTTEFIQLNSIIMGPDADISVTTNS